MTFLATASGLTIDRVRSKAMQNSKIWVRKKLNVIFYQGFCFMSHLPTAISNSATRDARQENRLRTAQVLGEFRRVEIQARLICVSFYCQSRPSAKASLKRRIGQTSMPSST